MLMRLALAGALALASMTHAYAFDNGQWGDDPQLRQWFKSLRSDAGGLCCDGADGVRIEDPDWRELDGGAYEVYARGAWQRIEPLHVIQLRHPKIGYAILWWPVGMSKPSCFLPGARG